MAYSGYLAIGNQTNNVFTESAATGYVRKPIAFSRSHMGKVQGVGVPLKFTTTGVAASYNAYAIYSLATGGSPTLVYPHVRSFVFGVTSPITVNPYTVGVNYIDSVSLDDITLDPAGASAIAGITPSYVASSSPSLDNVISELKRRERYAEYNNPVTNPVYSGATIAWFTTGTLTQQWTVANSPAAFNASCGAMQSASGTNYFAGAWTFPSAGTLSGTPPFNVTTDPRFYFSNAFGRVRFRTAAAAFEMHGSWSDANSNFSVTIDNQKATPAGGLNPTANGGISVSFASRKDRIIEIAGSNAWGFRGIYTTSILDDVSPAPAQGPLWVFDGDSFTQGGGLETPVDPDAPWFVQAAHLLGIDNYYPTAVTSTGYLSQGNPFPGGSIPTLRQRLQGGGWSLINGTPDVIVAAAGYNDLTWIESSSITQLQLTAELQLYIAALRATYPRAIIMICGPWSGARGPDAQTIAAEQGMQTVVNSFNDRLIKFIPVSTALPKPWIYGTGRNNATTGDGNSDWCTGPGVPHPCALGHAHLGARFASSARDYLRSL